MDYQIIAHQHIFQPEAFFPQCHASTIERLPDGGLVCAWFGGSHERAADVGIWLARKAPDALSWETPVEVASAKGVPCWNPVLFYDHTQEKLLLFYKTGWEIPAWETMLKESVDGGLTWSPARFLVDSKEAGAKGGRGPVKNKCIRLQDGSILAPASVETADQWTCFTDRSEDGGKTWISSQPVPVQAESLSGMGVIQPTLWQDDQGTVHMLMRSTEGAIMESRSEDNGQTWSACKRTALPNNNCGIDVTRLRDGRLVLIYNPVSGNWAARSPIAFSVSEDNGESWSKPQVLDMVPGCDRNEEDSEFSYPAVISHGDDIMITYTWKRRTIAFWQIRLQPKINIPVSEQQRKGEGRPIRDGVWVTMVTPFTEDNQVDIPALEALVEWYISQGVDGLFAVCQSSEMFFLTAEERAEAARIVTQKAAGRVQVVVSGHVSDTLPEQIAELKAAAAVGADAVVLVSNRLAGEDEDDEVWKRNAAAILEAIPECVFGIYECPYPYKRLLSPELLKWCANTGRFAFLKDTSCDLDQMKAKLNAVRGTPLKLFNANSATILESLRMGASGFCGVMANFHPALYVWLCRCWKGHRQKSEIVQHFMTATSLAELQMYPVCAKYHLQLCGVPIGLKTRSKDDSQWNRLREIETDALLRMWQDFQRSGILD